MVRKRRRNDIKEPGKFNENKDKYELVNGRWRRKKGSEGGSAASAASKNKGKLIGSPAEVVSDSASRNELSFNKNTLGERIGSISASELNETYEDYDSELEDVLKKTDDLVKFAKAKPEEWAKEMHKASAFINDASNYAFETRAFAEALEKSGRSEESKKFNDLADKFSECKSTVDNSWQSVKKH